MKNTLCAITLSIVPATVHAVPLNWTVSGGPIEVYETGYGGALSGGFTYDADTNTYSALDVMIAGSTILTLNGTYSHIYQETGDAFFDPTASVLHLSQNPFGAQQDGSRILRFEFNDPLTNAGGTFALDNPNQFSFIDCGGPDLNGDCHLNYPDVETLNASYSSVSSVPAPATLPLLFGGLIGFAAFARRRA